jgi:putative transposase
LWDTALDDLPDTPTWLAQALIAQIVAEGIHWRDGRVYELVAYCIMPNHVHLVIKPLNDATNKPYPLSTILHSLKLRTAKEANQILGWTGAFWQHESYDHVARDGAEQAHIVD